jgi:hypothetical protein
MKTENFDDSLRRKLESIDYPFKEQDVEYVHQYVQTNMHSPSFWKRFRHTFILSLYGITLVGLLTWNYKQFQQQEVLLKNIETLQKTITLTKSNSTPAILSDGAIGSNYIASGSENAITDNYKITLENNQEYTSDNYLNHKISKRKYTQKNKNYTSEELDYLYKENQTHEISYSKNLSKRKTINNNSSYVDDDVFHSSQEKSVTLSREDDKNSLVFKKDLEITNAAISNQLSTSARTNVLSEEKMIRPDSLVKNNESNKEIISSTNTGAKKQHYKNHLSLKNLGYQAGLGIEKSNNQVGIALLGEIFVSKRFSVNTGVKFLNITNENYLDKDDFYNKRNEHFCSTYAPNESDTSLVSEIEMQYNLMQIPVALNYYQPLKKNYSLLFSAGTDLDLYTNLNIHYEHGDPRIHEHISTKYTNVVFNNISLSTGIQKQWNHFILQLNPFLSPQVKHVDYKKDNLYGGLRLRAFYRFK